MGIPQHLISLMRNLYLNQQATVCTEFGDTDTFGIGKGVPQGCILSPTLFNLYTERIMREAGLEESEEGIRIGGRKVNNLRYADDTTLLAGSKDGLHNLLTNVQTHSEKAGLYLNTKKTKIMSTAKIDSFAINGVELEVVRSFVFLGSTIEEDGDCKEEIKRRLALGRASMGGLEKIWKDKNITMQSKIRLVNALVFPVALYGCESWTLRQNERKKVDAFEQWCWRRMLRIPWTARRTNKSIADEVNANMSLQGKIIKQKLSFFGHVMRANGLEKSIMLGMGEGKRGRGRPRTRWLDEIQSTTGLNLHQLSVAVEDRNRWRARVMDVARDRTPI